jgi:hypothetical protein
MKKRIMKRQAMKKAGKMINTKSFMIKKIRDTGINGTGSRK